MSKTEKESGQKAQNVKKCSITALAELLNCSVRNVNQLAKDHIIPMPDKDHKYDWLACNHSYITFWKEKALLSKSKLDEEIKEIKKEKERFLLEQEKGQWIRRDDVVNELVRRIHVIKSDLLNLIKRMPPQSRERYLRNERAGFILIILVVMLAGGLVMPIVNWLFKMIVGS